MVFTIWAQPFVPGLHISLSTLSVLPATLKRVFRLSSISCSFHFSSLNWFAIYYLHFLLLYHSLYLKIPISVFQLTKLFLSHGIAFPHKTWYTYFKEYLYQHMYMTRSYFWLRYCFSLTQYFPYCFDIKHFSAIFESNYFVKFHFTCHKLCISIIPILLFLQCRKAFLNHLSNLVFFIQKNLCFFEQRNNKIQFLSDIKKTLQT